MIWTSSVFKSVIASFTLAFIVGIAIFPGSSFAQNSEENVTFVHGIDGNTGSWKWVDNQISSEYLVNTKRIGYSSDRPISSIANDNAQKLLPNSVVIAHSMGGVVSREMIQQGRDQNFDALITAGSPHRGALVANALNQGLAQYAVGITFQEMAEGPARACAAEDFLVCGSPAGYGLAIANEIAGVFGFGSLVDYLEPFSELRSLGDLELGGSFIDGLNQNPAETLPSTHYAIYGNEDLWPSFRLAESWATNNQDEDGDFVRGAAFAALWYAAFAYRYQRKADRAWQLWQNTGKIRYYNMYNDYLWVAEGFAIGNLAIVYRHHVRWNIVTGQIAAGELAPQDVFVDGDAVVPTPSAAPNFILQSQTFKAEGTNHVELRGPNGKIALEDVFSQDDLDIPQDGGDDDPPPPPDPCEAALPPCPESKP